MSTSAVPRFGRAEFLGIARRAFERDFDAAAHLVGRSPWYLPPSLALAGTLLSDGANEARARAEWIVSTVLSAQERRPGHPDRGHFRMCFADPVISDLNAVRLVLVELIPLAITFGGGLSERTRDDVTAGIRAGILAIDDTSVQLTYSNVVLLDVANQIVGGEYLGDSDAIASGTARLDDFLERANLQGGIHDYNSPAYLGQMLNTLAMLATFTCDPLIRRKSELLQERIWLQVATHYHPRLAQLAGPYSRAYPWDVSGDAGEMKAILYAYLDDERLLGEGSGAGRLEAFASYHLATRVHYVPRYLLDLAARKTLPFEVRESADRENGLGLTSYLGKAHSLGAASSGFGSQARNLLVHAAPRHERRTKVLFSRYFAGGEARDLNVGDPTLAEWGLFAGLQSGRRAIALYGVGPDYRAIDTLRTDLILMNCEEEDSAWTAGHRLFPEQAVAAGQWIFFDLGSAYAALFPLQPTALDGTGEGAVSLHRDGGALRLSITNYQGPARHFWQYCSLPWEHSGRGGGPFDKGNLHAGFLIETADANEWTSLAEYVATVERSIVTDVATPGIRRVRFERDGASLELALDLHRFISVERLVDGVPERAASLEAPGVAVSDGRLAAINATDSSAAECGVWVARYDAGFSAANPTSRPTALRFGDVSLSLPAFSRAETVAEAVSAARVAIEEPPDEERRG